ncbi:MAG: peptidoglycan editing factor PgeF [Gammaproteobacteria bacterium]|nr:peptidoglycan editing factor PgeF [Gammaproteobacteria bacterium]
MKIPPIETVPADWSAPAGIRALTTCRTGGVSKAPYDTLNLALHVDDRAADVYRNRDRLRLRLGVPAEPVWLGQIHGTRVIDAASRMPTAGADGSFTDRPGVVCAVLSADCLPLFLCDVAGAHVALFHVGWRGLAAGVVEAGVAALKVAPERLLAWLGPAIGADVFEIGDDVKSALLGNHAGLEPYFKPSPRPRRWFANLYRLVAARLEDLGVHQCAWDESLCTLSNPDRFFSYRRDPRCGRMASLIWIE